MEYLYLGVQLRIQGYLGQLSLQFIADVLLVG
jgi:hypothetical protein